MSMLCVVFDVFITPLAPASGHTRVHGLALWLAGWLVGWLAGWLAGGVAVRVV